MFHSSVVSPVWMKNRLIVITLFASLSGCQKPSVETRTLPAANHNDGWVSSGGDLQRDAKNAWWTHQVPEVTYCIEIDHATVSADEMQIDKFFKVATDYWRSEFASQYRVLGREAADYRIAQNRFRKVSCGEGAMLRLLFGYGTLSEKERQFLGQTERLIVRAIRTEYDGKTLAGKGFIYFASDRGENRFKQEVYETPWKVELILLKAMAHELGHVFGIPHIEPWAAFGNPLMSESALDHLFEDDETQKAMRSTYLEKWTNITPQIQRSILAAFLSPVVESPFHHGFYDRKALVGKKGVIPRGGLALIYHFNFDPDENGGIIHIEEHSLGWPKESEKPELVKKPVGMISQIHWNYRKEWLATLITPDQYYSWESPIAFSLTYSGSGLFTSTAGWKKPVSVTVAPAGVSFTVLVDGKIEALDENNIGNFLEPPPPL